MLPKRRNLAPPEVRAALRRLDEQIGVRQAAIELGLSREAFARLVAGLHVRPGTIALAEQWYAQAQTLSVRNAVPRSTKASSAA